MVARFKWATVRRYFVTRMREPTTWAGLMLMATAAGVKLTPEWAGAITFAGTLIAGALAAGMPEAGAPDSMCKPTDGSE